MPKKEEIPKNIYYDDLSDTTINFFNDFILVNKDIYNEFRKDDDEGYNFVNENPKIYMLS